MEKILHALFIVVTAGLTGWALPACGTRTGALSDENRTELQVLAAAPEFQTEAKYHKIAGIMCKLCEESLSRPDSGAVFHLQEFEFANREALLQLRREVNDWQKSLSDEERLRFAMKVMSESYANRLLNCDRSMRQRPAVVPLYRQLVEVIEIRR